MFIQTEATPNPATLKFLPGKVVLDMGTADFRADKQGLDDAAAKSPLAAKLLEIDGVAGVFFGYDFITITKSGGADGKPEWIHMRPAILGTIMEHYVSGQPVMAVAGKATSMAPEAEDFDPSDERIVATIKELLETRIRPAVAQDGGDITFQGFRDGQVKLHMKGACAGCPSSTATLKHGIQNLLKHFIPEVQEVVQV